MPRKARPLSSAADSPCPEAALDTTGLDFLSPSQVLVATPIPQSATIIVWLLGSLFATSATAMGLIEVDRVVTAAGRVVSTNPTIVVQPLETSIVRSIDVREGQKVHAGDLLAHLDPTFAAADADALHEQIALLEAKCARLSNEVEGRSFEPVLGDATVTLQAAIYEQRQAERGRKLESFRQKIDGLVVTAAETTEDVDRLRKRLVIATDVETMRRTLAQDLVGSRLNWLAASDSRIEIERDLTKAIAASRTAANDLAAMQADRDAYVAGWTSAAAQELSDESNKLKEARDNLAKATKRRSLAELRAERDATVLTVARVSAGSVLQSGERLMTMVPADAPLEIEASIRGQENGFVRSGDPVDVKFDTFPFSQFGLARGTVRVVSADSFAAADQQDARPARDGPLDERQFYRARIRIDNVSLSHVPAGFHITPGMPVTVDINIGRHNLLASMMNRLWSTAGEGMREP